jgi:hypothetical protein
VAAATAREDAAAVERMWLRRFGMASTDPDIARLSERLLKARDVAAAWALIDGAGMREQAERFLADRLRDHHDKGRA